MKLQIRARKPTPLFAALSLLSLFIITAAAAPRLSAQAVTPPPAAAGTGVEDNIIQLSVFEVTESSDDSYQAVNTNSITGTKLELGRVPIFAEERCLKFALGHFEKLTA